MYIPPPDKQKARPADHARCRSMLRDGSHSFNAAAQVLPSRTRASATALYAFCRMADDAVDHAADGKRALVGLRSRLDHIYRGVPLDQPVDRVLADLVIRHGVPREAIEALFEGFEWDACGHRYQTISDVRAYGIRVAGTVGVMMALLMGVREPAALARACDLGVAMQLTNIARDVGEDANAGRLYLPMDWMVEEGLDPDAWLKEPVMGPALGRVIERLLAEADRLYRMSEPGIRFLPFRCRAGIYAARYIYADIGTKLSAQGFDSVSQRTVVSFRRKLSLIAGAFTACLKNPAGLAAEPLPEAVPLLSAVAAAEPTGRRARSLDDKLGWFFSVIERLERDDNPDGHLPPPPLA